MEAPAVQYPLNASRETLPLPSARATLLLHVTRERECSLRRPTSVVLADEHSLMRRGLGAVLLAEPDMQLVAEAKDGAEAVQACQRLSPDVAVMSPALPRMGGLAAMQQLLALGLPTHTLALTIFNEADMLPKVLAVGGLGYVRKETADADLGDAVRTAARGEAFLYASGVRLLLDRYVQARDPAEAWERARPALSRSDAEVLRLTAEGYTNPEIGRWLSITPRSVERQQRSIVERLGLHSHSEFLHPEAIHGMHPPSSGETGRPLT